MVDGGAPSGPTGPALVIAALVIAAAAAVLFAWAATWQHEAIGGRFRLERVVSSPRWLAGIALSGAAALLHLVALALAPVSVVQPVGVLAVPAAVVIAARRGTRATRRDSARRSGCGPSRRTFPAALATVLGVTTLVTAIGFSPGPGPAQLPSVGGLWWTGALLLLGGLGTAALSALEPRLVRCVCLAGAGAVAFGLAAALLRALFVRLAGVDASAGGEPVPAVSLTLLITGCYVLGGWLVQRAYAAGSPGVVLGCLTLLDPLVAVGLGVVVLGEGAGIGPGGTTLAALGAATAVAGIVVLSRDLPHAVPGATRSSRPPSDPSSDSSLTPSSMSSTHPRSTPTDARPIPQ